MKHFRFLFLILSVSVTTGIVSPVVLKAQCAMCSLNAENAAANDNAQGKGLNDGILFLLAVPYLIAVGIGILWYKKYRKTQAKSITPLENLGITNSQTSSSTGE